MAHGWEGEKVRLVPLDLDRHFDNAVRWLNDPEITQWLKVGDFPITRFAEKQWFEKELESTPKGVPFAIETLEEKQIGFSGVHKINWRRGSAISGTFIGDTSDWGKGFGTDAAKVRLHYAFDVLGLRIMYSFALEGNERSLRMLLRARYKEWGGQPKAYWKRGEFRDARHVYIDREMWLKTLKG